MRGLIAATPDTTREDAQADNRRRELLRLAAVSRKRLAAVRAAYRAKYGAAARVEDSGAIAFPVVQAIAAIAVVQAIAAIAIAREALVDRRNTASWYPCPECLEGFAGKPSMAVLHTSPLCRP